MRSHCGRFWTKYGYLWLFLLATAVAVLVCLVDTAGLLHRYQGGRARESGFAWLLHLLALKTEFDIFPHLPGALVRFHQFQIWTDVVRFLGVAILINAAMAWLFAAVLMVLPRRLRAPAHLEECSPAQLAGIWLLFFSPAVLHLACETSILGLGIGSYLGRLSQAATGLVLAWVALAVFRPLARGWPGATRVVAVAGSAAGAVIVLLGGVITGLSSPGGSQTPPAKPGLPNIFLVSIDSLRADHLHCYGASRETSPNLDALAAEGTLFRYVVSPTSWTLPAHMTLLTGLAPPQHGVYRDFTRLAGSATTLAEVLREAGYQTAAIVSAPYLRAEYGFQQGFEEYNDYAATSLVKNAQSNVTSPVLEELARDWITRWSRQVRRRPFFLFLHMWDVHSDYIPPSPYDTMFDPGYTGSITAKNYENTNIVHPGISQRDLEHIIALYDGEIRFTDHHLGRIFELLHQMELMDDTIMAVTADHGDEFFEHGQKGHRHSLYDEVLLVPLILRYPPKVPVGLVSHELARLVDIAPTLLSLAGVPQPEDFGVGKQAAGYRGRDLIPRLWNGAASAEPVPVAFGDLAGRLGSVRTDRWKLVVRLQGDPQPELYDLAADRGEQNNVARLYPAEVDRLYDNLIRFLKEQTTVTPAERMKVNREHVDVLRSLGYVK